MSHIHSERPAPLRAVTVMLLVSGGCALVFQVVWIRELRLVFGATTASSAAVLAIFMAGMGLGNGLFGRWIDDSVRPLKIYGLLEAGIAFSVGLSPLLIDVAKWAYVGLGGPELATVIRLLASAAILAVPTFLMGGTLPAAARAVSTDADIHRRGVALLYTWNTLGAVAGAGLATFVLLEAYGGRKVLWTACLVNSLLAAIAAGLSLHLCKHPVGKVRRRKSQSTPLIAPAQKPTRVGVVYFSAGIVGFVFFLMEIVWYRMLGPLLGGTTYTFGLILSVALLGIGVGGAVYTLVTRWLKPSLQLLTVTCALEAFLIAVPFWRGDYIALWVLQQQSEFIASFADQIWNWLEVAAFVILPPAMVARGDAP
jgi:spermidine synthase